jgi:hypothetical protein
MITTTERASALYDVYRMFMRDVDRRVNARR